MVGKACNTVTTVFDLIDNPLLILHLLISRTQIENFIRLRFGKMRRQNEDCPYSKKRMMEIRPDSVCWAVHTEIKLRKIRGIYTGG